MVWSTSQMREKDEKSPEQSLQRSLYLLWYYAGRVAFLRSARGAAWAETSLSNAMGLACSGEGMIATLQVIAASSNLRTQQALDAVFQPGHSVRFSNERVNSQRLAREGPVDGFAIHGE
jgi:hypothetical protein